MSVPSVTLTKQNKTSVLKSQDSPSFPFVSGGHGDTAGIVSNHLEKGGQEGLSNSTAPKERVADGAGRGSPSLDTYRPSSNNAYRPKWDKKQKRGYHRIQSCLQYWLSQGYQVLWVMLSTADGGNAKQLAYHHQRLRQQIERKLDYPRIQHYQVRTSEGNGVLHVFWAWRARDGFRQRSFYVKQDWLSRRWQDIHGARIVWITRVKGGRISRDKVSRYCMSQYVGGQAGYEYMSWSWGRTFGFPLVGCWRAFKGIWSKHNGNGSKNGLYSLWGAFLSGEVIPLLDGWYTSLEVVRLGYQEYQSAFWASAVDTLATGKVNAG